MKLVRKILLALTILIVFFLVAGIFIQLVLGGSIKTAIINKINANLITELVVKGDIDFTVFRNFPFMAVDFNKVQLKEGIAGSKNDLLVADRVSLQFNIWSIISGNNIIRRIKIINGKINITIDKTGSANYFIIKKSTGKTNNNSQLQIDKIILENIVIKLDDEYNHQHYDLSVNSSVLSGNFSEEKFNLNIQSDLFITQLIIQNVCYAKNKEANIQMELEVNLKDGIYKFNKGTINVAEADFKLSGSIKDEKKKFTLDLFISGDEIGLEELGALLPEEYMKPLKGLDTKGDLIFTGTIKGPLSHQINPAVNFRFDIKRATIKHKDSGNEIDRVNLTATYSNGTKKNWKNSVLKIQNGTAFFNNKPFNYDLLLTQFQNPILDLKLNGSVDLKILSPFVGLEKQSTLTGEMQLVNFSFRGMVGDIANQKALATQSEGSIKLINTSFHSPEFAFDNLNSFITSSGNEIDIQQCNFNIKNTDLSISGDCKGLIPFLFKSIADTTWKPSNAFAYNLSVVSKNMNTSDFSSHNNSTTKDFSLPAILVCGSGKAIIKIGTYTNNAFIAKNISTSLISKDKHLYFNNLSLQAVDGVLTANGNIDISDSKNIVLESTISCTELNINKLFTQFKNFDQTAITDKNIKGILTCKCYIKAFWINGIFDMSKLIAIADVNIDKGELNEFKPLYSLSKFVKVKDLESIRFSKLSNQISIRNGVVNIPTTTILSNALNLELTGTHTFENYIDYKIKVNFLKLLSGKFKNSSFDPAATEEDVNGTLNLFVLMKGPADNPTIIYDKSSVKKIIKQNMVEEKNTLKDVLKKEFSQQENQQQKIKDWSPPEQYELIEFDNDSTDNKN